MTRIDIPLSINTVDYADTWAMKQAFQMAYYFNPQAHGNESLELFAQVVEKEGYTIGL